MDLAFGRRVLRRVGQQIDQHLQQASAVGVDNQWLLRQIQVQGQMSCLNGGIDDLHRLVNGLG